MERMLLKSIIVELVYSVAEMLRSFRGVEIERKASQRRAEPITLLSGDPENVIIIIKRPSIPFQTGNTNYNKSILIQGDNNKR